jgi:dCTP deaminase
LILSDLGIKKRLEEGSLIIEPLSPEQIQPASIDMHLGNQFMKVDDSAQKILKPDKQVEYIRQVQDSMIVSPGSFLLVVTKQYVELPYDLTAFVEGLSSMGRMGLLLQNDGWVDPGFKGALTLAFFNANKIPVELHTGCRICQLVLAALDQPATSPYKGKYQGYKSIVGSKVYKDPG